MSKYIIRLFVLFLLLFGCAKSYSQNVLLTDNLSQIKIDQLSDNDLISYRNQILAKGLTLEQSEQLALSKGLPPAELAKLRNRLAALNNNNNQTGDSKNNSLVRGQQLDENQTENKPFNSKIFGAELFSTTSLSFQPDLKIATPVNYILGPDDQLQIAVYGLQESSFSPTVSPEGSIYVPNVGEIQVSGYTIEEARARIRSRMASIFTSLRSGSSSLSINLGKIRSIRVTVLGSNKPGTITISSLSTLFNALYLSGGPSKNGSFRQIELLRNNKIERKIDLYNFLLTGSEADNVRLRENDIIRIPVYENRVEIAGEIKRPGIFEMLKRETLNDLIRFASGFTDSAYRASIKVTQLTPTDRRIKDVTFDDFKSYSPASGDYLEVQKILNSFQNRISIEGAVLRPGDFELTQNLTISQLIRKANGLRKDAYTKRAQLIRAKEDLTPEIISFDVSAVLNGTSDITLQREDRVIITSINDLKDQYSILIQGEVRKPANYRFVEGLTLKDVILQAGGFTDAAFPQRIEIARVIRRDTLTAQDVRLSENIDIRNVDDLSLGTNNISLQPFDVITVRRLPGYLPLESVTATGQVQFPGPYVLNNRIERVSDLLKRSGGLTPEAFADGAFLRRLNTQNISKTIEAQTVDKIQKQLKDSTGEVTGSVLRPFDQIPLNLSRIINYPGSDDNLVLKPGDELFIPRNDQQIKITGEVLFPTQSPFNAGKDLKDYIRDAGGFTDNARRKRAYVLYPNGKAASTSHFLFFRSYPSIKPGSEIIVPKYVAKDKPKRTTTETVALASALASLAYLVIAIIRL